ncbi:MAG: hypothetical protein WBK60_06335, partial [bacterium]
LREGAILRFYSPISPSRASLLPAKCVACEKFLVMYPRLSSNYMVIHLSDDFVSCKISTLLLPTTK